MVGCFSETWCYVVDSSGITDRIRRNYAGTKSRGRCYLTFSPPTRHFDSIPSSSVPLSHERVSPLPEHIFLFDRRSYFSTLTCARVRALGIPRRNLSTYFAFFGNLLYRLPPECNTFSLNESVIVVGRSYTLLVNVAFY